MNCATSSRWPRVWLYAMAAVLVASCGHSGGAGSPEPSLSSRSGALLDPSSVPPYDWHVFDVSQFAIGLDSTCGGPALAPVSDRETVGLERSPHRGEISVIVEYRFSVGGTRASDVVRDYGVMADHCVGEQRVSLSGEPNIIVFKSNATDEGSGPVVGGTQPQTWTILIPGADNITWLATVGGAEAEIRSLIQLVRMRS